MSMLTKYLAVALLLFGSMPALADRDYKCIIERVAGPQESSSGFKALRDAFVGQMFTVERRSGLMAGALKNSYATKPQVIDPGDNNENSFKVVTTMRRDQGVGFGSMVYSLIVHGWVETRKKPFAFMQGAEVFFGSCEEF